ncbi:TlpA family protein disulfide reductase [Helicobacter cynogastricus]|uniref:TlpA family protein disulfide reductase n=1 Tax=Helicobacter cynogastricus TaxID=329937 RepID=UPI001F23BD4F|nr:hypothetical protein [Helicobacter cynogastricus]
MALKCALILLLLGLSACSDQHKKKENTLTEPATKTKELPTTWEFLNQQGQISILKHTPKGLELQGVSAQPIFMLFLSLEPKFAPYSALLKHLQSNFKEVSFVAVLDKPYKQETIDAYIKAHTLKFTLLNPKDNLDSLRVSLGCTQWQLPYFFLYKPDGSLYQSYHGAVVEEMLAKDIQDLLNTQAIKKQ